MKACLSVVKSRVVQANDVPLKVQENKPQLYQFICDALQTVDLLSIQYPSEKELINGFVLAPKQMIQPAPLVLYCRGGAKNFGMLTIANVLRQCLWLCQKGYVVAASQYRGNGGSTGKDQFCGQDVFDVLNLKEVFNECQWVNQSNISIIGHSRGGSMVLHCLSKVNWIKKAVSIAGVSDLAQSYLARPTMQEFHRDMYEMTTQNIQKRSPIYWADAICKNTPLLLAHGIDDRKVHYSQSVKMAEALKKLNRPATLQLYFDDHSFSNHLSLMRRNVLQFLEEV